MLRSFLMLLLAGCASPELSHSVLWFSPDLIEAGWTVEGESPTLPYGTDAAFVEAQDPDGVGVEFLVEPGIHWVTMLDDTLDISPLEPGIDYDALRIDTDEVTAASLAGQFDATLSQEDDLWRLDVVDLVSDISWEADAYVLASMPVMRHDHERLTDGNTPTTSAWDVLTRAAAVQQAEEPRTAEKAGRTAKVASLGVPLSAFDRDPSAVGFYGDDTACVLLDASGTWSRCASGLNHAQGDWHTVDGLVILQRFTGSRDIVMRESTPSGPTAIIFDDGTTLPFAEPS